METAPCNDTTHGSLITVTIMGLDGITGGQLGLLGAPMIHLSVQKCSLVPPLITLMGQIIN